MSDDEYDFDPWETTSVDPVKVETLHERAWPASLYKRALTRLPDVTRVDGRRWTVLGVPRLGDTFPSYEVRWLGQDDYHCDCQEMSYGDTRARRGCSHVLAVMIQRSHNGFTPSDGPSDEPSDGGERPVRGNSAAPATGRQLELAIPSISDPRLLRDEPPLPPKFTAFRPGQWEAITEIVEAYRAGADVVWLDAPTGSGKTVVGEAVRRMLHARGLYVCHSKPLQKQFLADFDYSQMLMGRANYPTDPAVDGVTCEDCTREKAADPCTWCADAKLCPYQIAKREAAMARLAVLNTAYFLTEANWIGKIGLGRDLVIVDECDALENELMGFVEFFVSERMLWNLKLSAPKEGSHRTTLAAWIVNELRPAVKAAVAEAIGDGLDDIRIRHRFGRLLSNVNRLAKQIEEDAGLEAWVRDNRAGPFVLKPVTVNLWGTPYLWRHAPKWLCMSATIISPTELATSTGLGMKWETVRMPMGFPVENRRIIVAPVADMSRKGKDAGEWDRALHALVRVCDRHPGDRILVHTVSYDLARRAHQHLRSVLRRPVHTYTQAAERDRVLSRFRTEGSAILVAPSMDRGVDLAEDDCRVIVVLKVPFPNLGDRQTSERLRQPDGEAWYATQTIRTLVQMTGRGVRSQSDWCVSYILDRQMVKDSKGRGGVLKRHRSLLPQWWRDALVLDFPVRQLLDNSE